MATALMARAPSMGFGSLVPATDQKPLSNFVNPMLTDMYQVRKCKGLLAVAGSVPGETRIRTCT
jgi:hypothetical protein